MSDRQYYNSKTKKVSRLKQLGLLLCMIPNPLLAQEEIIMFHNVENLFFPTNDTLTEDDEYTIDGKKHWTFGKYNAKLNALAKTYISVSKSQTPALIGLCEIENNRVLTDLTRNTPLRKIGYKFIHYPSQDIRGIDVALLYDPKKFKVQESFPMQRVSQKEEDRTRDVLYVRGLLGHLPVNIYVIHAPSRREDNIKKALRERIFRSVYDDIKKLQSKGEENFIVMGDMNDNPWDEAVEQGFQFDEEGFSKDIALYNLMRANKDVTGSYVYSGYVFSFDQIMVSQNIKNRIVHDESCNSTYIYKPEFLISKSKRNKYDRPFSTYKGLKYEGGISDHFPVILKIQTK